jgi:Zn-finger nucleic acid-binding protein
VEAARQAVVCPYCKVANAPQPQRVVVEVAVPVAVPAADARAMEGVTSLACPRCATVLFAAETHGVTLNGCGRCGGVWLDNDACQAAVRAYDADVVALERRAASHATARPRTGDAIACPLCKSPLQRTQAAGVVLDVCAAHGTWFDKSELEVVMRTYQAAASGRAAARATELAQVSTGPSEYARGASMLGGVALGVLGAFLSAKR